MDTRNGPLGLTLEDYWCIMPAVKASRLAAFLHTCCGCRLRQGRSFGLVRYVVSWQALSNERIHTLNYAG